ncbi:hypothetical protein IIA29_03690 [candidate division KSB1 bacterium]|nr:hypothetical protein [candidate division KSB1 bacterium]
MNDKENESYARRQKIQVPDYRIYVAKPCNHVRNRNVQRSYYNQKKDVGWRFSGMVNSAGAGCRQDQKEKQLWLKLKQRRQQRGEQNRQIPEQIRKGEVSLDF